MNRLYEHDLNANSLVLEIGAYKGAWGLEMHRRYGCRVVMFEPRTEFFVQILTAGGNERIRPVNAAIGKTAERRTLIIKGDMTGFYADQGDLENVDVIPIRHVVSILGIIDLCQINCEGSEFDILTQLTECRFITALNTLQIQWHPVIPYYDIHYARFQAELPITHNLIFDDPPSKWQIWKLR